MTKRYRSGPLAAVHETATGLLAVGVIDRSKMKQFDELCLTPVKEVSAKQVRRIRRRGKAN